jgi:hypothetical protein
MFVIELTHFVLFFILLPLFCSERESDCAMCVCMHICLYLHVIHIGPSDICSLKFVWTLCHDRKVVHSSVSNVGSSNFM